MAGLLVFQVNQARERRHRGDAKTDEDHKPPHPGYIKKAHNCGCSEQGHDKGYQDRSEGPKPSVLRRNWSVFRCGRVRILNFLVIGCVMLRPHLS